MMWFCVKENHDRLFAGNAPTPHYVGVICHSLRGESCDTDWSVYDQYTSAIIMMYKAPHSTQFFIAQFKFNV